MAMSGKCNGPHPKRGVKGESSPPIAPSTGSTAAVVARQRLQLLPAIGQQLLAISPPQMDRRPAPTAGSLRSGRADQAGHAAQNTTFRDSAARKIWAG